MLPAKLSASLMCANLLDIEKIYVELEQAGNWNIYIWILWTVNSFLI